MLRMDPGVIPVSHAKKFSVWEGGGEYNLAKSLSRVFGKKSAIVTAIVDNPIGKLLHSLILSSGVDDRYIIWKDFDGLGWKYRNPLNFTDRGFGPRAAVSCSDRGHSVCSLLQDWSIDWKDIFEQQGTKIFHTGGIFTSLSEHTYKVALQAIRCAKESGVLVSYDLNFRSSLWRERNTKNSLEERVQSILPHVDFLFGNESEYFLPLFAEETLKGNFLKKKNIPDINDLLLKARLEKLVTSYPHLQYVCVNIREAPNMSINHWRGLLAHDGQLYESMKMDFLPICDRIGSGDAFSSGILYGFLEQLPLQEILNYGVAHGALAMSTPGDTSMVSIDQVKNLVISKDDIKILR